MNFGNKILLLLREKQITQKELAEMINTTEASISRYINNNRLPKGDIIARIAEVLGTTSDFLLEDEKQLALKLLPDYVTNSSQYRLIEEIVQVTVEEKLLLDYYRKLNAPMKRALLSVGAALADETGKSL